MLRAFLSALYIMLGTGIVFAHTPLTSSVFDGNNSDRDSFSVQETVAEPGSGFVSYRPATGFRPEGDMDAAVLEVNVSLKAWLQGPYTNEAMNTSLNSGGVLPNSQPYNTAPWHYAGGESVIQSFLDANETIVDWVLLELREGPGHETVVARRAAFILNSGFVVDLDTSSDVKFEGVFPQSYYVVLRHRNHLDVMTPSAVDFSTGSGSWDFTTGQGQAYGANPMKSLGSGQFGLISGDATASGRVGAADNSAWQNDNGGPVGYHRTDATLSTRTGAGDYSLWLANNGQSTRVPDEETP